MLKPSINRELLQATPGAMAAGNVPQQAQGGQPWMSAQYTARTFFTYETDILVALNAGTTQNLTFNIAGDSDFFWTKFASYALINGAPTAPAAVPAVTMLLINTTTGRQYSSAPTPLPNISGNGGLPFILPQITLWQAKATIQVQLLNEGNVNYSNLHLSFHGIKAFSA